MDIQVETITPSKAAQWLEGQVQNRPRSKGTVARYAAAIRRGEWQTNGEAIKFDVQGHLIDGQHRLNAVVLADTAIESVVVRGLNGKAFETFDSGKGRRLPDLLALKGYVNVNVLAGMSRMLWCLKEFGNPISYKQMELGASPSIMVAFISDPSRQDALAEAASQSMSWHVKGSILTATTCAFLWYATHRANSPLADQFFDAMRSSVRPDDPAAVYAERVARSRLKKDRVHAEEAAAFGVKAWNAFAQNQPIKQLMYRVVGSKAESFPNVFGLTSDRI